MHWIKLFLKFTLLLILFTNSKNIISESNQNKILHIEDFLIIEITEEDVPKNNIKIDNFFSDNARYLLRKLHAIFLKEFRSNSKCLILDFWYPDSGINEIDEELIHELKLTKNAIIGLGGRYRGEIEFSKGKFIRAAHNVGHLFVIKDKKDGISIKNKFKSRYIIRKSNKETIEGVEEHKYISLVALDILEIQYNVDSIIKIPSKDIKQFKRVTFSEALANKNLADDKIIILIIQFEWSKDIKKIAGYGEITGPEIICNFIMFTANNYHTTDKVQN